jgi:hypothetical protein
MNGVAIGAVGEIVGALAAVITLIYPATQVRTAKQAAADQNRLIPASGGSGDGAYWRDRQCLLSGCPLDR